MDNAEDVISYTKSENVYTVIMNKKYKLPQNYVKNVKKELLKIRNLLMLTINVMIVDNLPSLSTTRQYA